MRPALPGHLRVNNEKLHRADVEIFRKLRELTRDGFHATGPVKPIDELVDKVLDSENVRMMLLPIRGSAAANSRARSRSGENGRKARGPKRKNQKEKLQEEVSRLRSRDSQGRSGTTKGNGGKGQGRSDPPPLPAELRGKSASMPDGKFLCFAYNMRSGCQADVEKGGRCRRGWHLCMEPGCGKTHPVHKHHE